MSKQYSPAPWGTEAPQQVSDIERYHGIIVAIGGIPTKSVILPDWGLSYIEYPPGKMKEFRQILMRGHVPIIKVTGRRIYYEQ